MQSARLSPSPTGSLQYWREYSLQATLGVLMTTASLFQVGRGHLIVMDWQIITHSLYTAKKHDTKTLKVFQPLPSDEYSAENDYFRIADIAKKTQ